MSPIDAATLADALALNNAHATELSWHDAASFRRLLDAAFYARWAADRAAFLIAFDQDAAYGSENFLWFRRNYARFVYVDRVVVRPDRRREGHAGALYRDLFARAAAACHASIVCEVNRVPPNPASDAFHAAFGFVPVGSATLAAGDKAVRYLHCRIRA